MTCKILETLQGLCQECEYKQPVKEVNQIKIPISTLKWGPISKKEMTWDEAVKWCEKQKGRLPTRVELLELINNQTEETQKRMGDNRYWSSSHVGDSDSVWAANFYLNHLYYDNKDNLYRVRCICGD